jgi:hypothetical protein
MPYKKKLSLLAAAAAVLALVYGLTLFFDPARTNARNAVFTWLPPGARDAADSVEISRGGGEPLSLVLRNGRWVTPLPPSGGENGAGGGALEVPVKQGRVDDLFRLLSARGAFPRRGSSAASHENLGLGDGAARLVIRGGPGLPLLDLLVGKDDPSGDEVFLRKNGEDVFRSGDRLISSYVNGERTAWYDLRLFDGTALDDVQRVGVNFAGSEGNVNYRVVRSGDGWTFEGGEPIAGKDKVESWIRDVLEAQGEDFVPPGDFTAADEIRMELGDGSSLVLRIGPPPPSAAGEDPAPEGGPRSAMAGGKPYGFTLSPWTVSRLLREPGYFR